MDQLLNQWVDIKPIIKDLKDMFNFKSALSDNILIPTKGVFKEYDDVVLTIESIKTAVYSYKDQLEKKFKY